MINGVVAILGLDWLPTPRVRPYTAERDSSGLNVPPVAETNVPGIAETNVPAVAE